MTFLFMRECEMMSEKKAPKAIPQRILATVLTLALLILTFPTALMASAEESPQAISSFPLRNSPSVWAISASRSWFPLRG